MMINWKVRLKNINFWLTIIPALLLLAEQVAKMFGCDLDLNRYKDGLEEIVRTVFLLLVAFGIVNDPTTKGAGDSAQALTYDKPKG